MRIPSSSPATLTRTGTVKRAVRRLSLVEVVSDDQPANSARFASTSCSQCGGTFGPGAEGYSHCDQHALIDGQGYLGELPA